MRPDIVPGAIFPDYELSDHTAKRRKLSELQGQHPMVLVLSRGGFCPKDRRQAEGLVELHRELEVAYCRLVTISTDNITQTNEYRSGVGAHWPFLSDAGRIVQKDLDIAEYTDPVNNPMIPHVIVLEPGLVIYKIYNGYWFFGRPYALTAGDAQTLGGQPLSAFVLASAANGATATSTNSAATANAGSGGIVALASPQATPSTVTTSGAALTNYLAKFTSQKKFRFIKLHNL